MSGPKGQKHPRATDQPWYRINALAETSAADVYIYDEIGASWWGGISAQQFARDLDALEVETINLYVNSPGGDVYEGIAIKNALRRHKARVVATVEGLAASAASFILTGADEVVMAPNSEVMIHDAWGYAFGNAEQLAKYVEMLNRTSDNIASMYAAKAGGDEAEWRDLMRAETWYSAAEAVEAGLADRIDGDQLADDVEAAKNRFDLSMFNHAGRATAPTPAQIFRSAAARKEPPAEPVEGDPTPPEKGTVAMSILNQGLRDRLGITADAELDESALLAALDQRLTERPANQIQPGTVVLDEAQHRDLLAQAARGVAAEAAAEAAARAALVEAAVEDGRIAPARRDHWLATLEADPGMADVLAGLAPGLVPLDAKGFTGGVDEASDEDDRIYSKYFPTEEGK